MSKVKVTRRFTQRGLNAWGRCSGDRENVWREKLLLRCVCSAAREALVQPREEERGWGISCRHAHSLFRKTLNVGYSLNYLHSDQKCLPMELASHCQPLLSRVRMR